PPTRAGRDTAPGSALPSSPAMTHASSLLYTPPKRCLWRATPESGILEHDKARGFQQTGGSDMNFASRRQFLILAGRGSLAIGSTALLAACGSPSTTAPAPTSAPAAAPTVAAAAKPTSAPAAAPTSAPAAAPTSAPAAAPTTAPAAAAAGDINLYVGGDVNIRDLWQKQLLPAYKKVKPALNFTLVFDEHALSEQNVFDKLAAAKQAGAVSGVDLWEAGGRLSQGGDAGLIQKVTSKDVPNLDKVPQDSLARFANYGVP